MYVHPGPQQPHSRPSGRPRCRLSGPCQGGYPNPRLCAVCNTRRRRRNPSGFGTSGAVAGMTAQRRHGPLDESISRGVRQARQSWLAFWRWSRRPTGAGVSPAARGSGLFVLEEPVDRPVAEDIVRDGTDGPHARWAHFHLREMDFERLGRVKVPTAVDAHESLSGRPTLEIPHRSILSASPPV